MQHYPISLGQLVVATSVLLAQFGFPLGVGQLSLEGGDLLLEEVDLVQEEHAFLPHLLLLEG
jgi:hypothetical protein